MSLLSAIEVNRLQIKNVMKTHIGWEKNTDKYTDMYVDCFCTLYSLKVNDKEKLHGGRNIAHPADDEDDNLELLDGEEHRPKWKGAQNLCPQCWR